MKKLVIKLTPEQQEDIRKVFGIESKRECKYLQIGLEKEIIESIRSCREPPSPVPPYLVVPSIDEPIKETVSLF